MKLLFASDIHGSASAARNVIKTFEQEKADYLVFLGDVMYHGPRNPLPDGYNPAEVAGLLNSVANKVIAVRGNCDAEVDQMLLDFPLTADYNIIALKDFKIFASHGHTYSPDNLPSGLTSKDIFASGHTHIPALEKKDGRPVIFNPGSAALPKENHPATYGVVEDGKIQIKTFDGAIYEI